MVQAICTIADSIQSSGLSDSGILGWLVVWGCYIVFAYLGFTLLLIPWFTYFYAYPTYDKWRCKTNPKYPLPTAVLGEIFLGVFMANPSVTFAPSIHLALIANGTLKHHCDTPLTWGYRLYSMLMVLIIVDFYSWLWHYLGHYVGQLWAVHRHHHHFANPTPFSTIADLPVDNIVRSLYMIVVNVVSYAIMGMPVDVDVLYFVTAISIGCYGMYFHCGHELECLPYDHPILNTSYQHYVHHALSYKNKPYYTGFVFKCWDNMAGAHYHGKQIIPALEDQKQGNRSRERWECEIKPNLPDYSVLLSPYFWAANWRHASEVVVGKTDAGQKKAEKAS
mmetsp:Transcript_96844/g.202352  ORF Transcript_96844/g.202352 Transcript_96844/m.202352 type:complete len:335 (-) Transcript_96844:261-1265(-)|eukprot:CAMPEP_0206449460 /NCGR_PEP_ID=MMETSP0324_2-20121206/18101_1 /ASSEMBLY_ACC=CAM_ASM_000836 /TAXON_ID=2866 /ORGANISM="Crypthecodinium cohnii, Strain Seligo" /LENGTH=334 /DNA_ID=CAMNT_0053918839 /DNA_START=250 /DNA_END=1254 /DNA_ORIENTATION=-